MRYTGSLIALSVIFLGCNSNVAPVKPTTVGTMPFIITPIDPEKRIENPAYSRWAKYAPGTVVEFEEVTVSSGKSTKLSTSYTLAGKNDDYLDVVVTGTTFDGNGVLQATEPQSLRQIRWMAKPENGKDPLKPAGTYDSGEETVTVRGKAYKTRWVKVKGQVEAGETQTQIWYCDEIPGALLKSVQAIPGVKKTVTSELVEVKSKS